MCSTLSGKDALKSGSLWGTFCGVLWPGNLWGYLFTLDWVARPWCVSWEEGGDFEAFFLVKLHCHMRSSFSSSWNFFVGFVLPKDWLVILFPPRYCFVMRGNEDSPVGFQWVKAIYAVFHLPLWAEVRGSVWWAVQELLESNRETNSTPEFSSPSNQCTFQLISLYKQDFWKQCAAVSSGFNLFWKMHNYQAVSKLPCVSPSSFWTHSHSEPLINEQSNRGQGWSNTAMSCIQQKYCLQRTCIWVCVANHFVRQCCPLLH